jgi:type IV pilus assembly protein PilV
MITVRALPANYTCAKGFSLVEVLVSLVIFAVGVLGLTGMYLSAIRAQADAKARSAITTYSAAMMDRIAANPKAAIAGNYNLSYGSAAPTNAQCLALNAEGRYWKQPAFANSLTPAAIASQEIIAFRNELGCNLPGGDVSIIAGKAPTPNQPPCTAALIDEANSVTVLVRWQDNRSAAQTGGIQGVGQYECYSLSMRIQ